MTPPPRRKPPLSPTEGPRPPRRRVPGPSPEAEPASSWPEAEPASSWPEAKVKAVLDSFRSFVGNAAKKHGVDPSEVADLVRDHLCDPD